MKKSLTSNGNGWELHIPKPILKLLNINPVDTKVLFEIKNKVLHVTPLDFPFDNEKYKNALVKKFTRRGGGYSLFMSQTILELIDIDPELDKAEIEVDDKILKIWEKHPNRLVVPREKHYFEKAEIIKNFVEKLISE